MFDNIYASSSAQCPAKVNRSNNNKKSVFFVRHRRVDIQPPLTAENNEQMLSELGKKYWVPPTRATLAGAAWLPRGAAGTGVGDGGLYWSLALLVLRHLATWHRSPPSNPLPAAAPPH